MTEGSLSRLRYEYIEPQEQLERAERSFVESFLDAALFHQIGWHYLTDLIWLCATIRTWPRGWTVLDAGGGSGPLQFLAAELGFDVVNVDLAHPPPARWMRERYSTGVKTLASHSETGYDRTLGFRKGAFPRLRKAVADSRLVSRWRRRRLERWRRAWNLPGAPGRIDWVVGNLVSMPEIETASFDAVISLSSIEHVPQADVPRVMAELRRVVRPDGRWAITTSATERTATWLHEPARGLCFSATDLERIFDAAPARAQSATKVLGMYASCDELRKKLAAFYRTSGHNGMPWGEWNPAYVPVGLSNQIAEEAGCEPS